MANAVHLLVLCSFMFHFFSDVPQIGYALIDFTGIVFVCYGPKHTFNKIFAFYIITGSLPGNP